MKESGRKRYCVVGHDIGYTLSPRLHAAVFACTGECAAYGVEDIAPEQFESAFARILHEYDGVNVTKPYKERAAAYMGSDKPINTVRCADGACTSTDAAGFLQDYTDAFGMPHGNVLLLGAGGAAKAVADALLNCESVTLFVYNRTYEKAADMAAKNGRVTAVRTAAGAYDAVVNGTTPGRDGACALPSELSFAGVQYAYDLVYTSPETPFLAQAKAAGAKTRNGLGMLIRQAIAAHEFWRGASFDEETKHAIFVASKAALV